MSCYPGGAPGEVGSRTRTDFVRWGSHRFNDPLRPLRVRANRCSNGLIYRRLLSGNCVARLEDKIVLITGAAGAIGQAVADAVRREGGDRDRERSRRAGTASTTRSTSPPRAIGTRDGRDRARARTARRPGQCRRHRARSATSRTPTSRPGGRCWRSISTARFSAASTRCRCSSARGGSIVNLSSVSGLVGGHNLAAYNASKGGVRLLTKSVALHGARLKPPVRCNSVHPAFLEGPMVDDMLRADRLARDRARRSSRATSRSDGSARRPRSPTCASICCPMNRASSPAPNSSSTAA